MSMAVFADNCQACGEEYLSTDLIAVKLGNYTLTRVRVCLGCLAHSNIIDDYKKASELIVQTKFAKKMISK
jgi:hypothetical protein